MARLDTSPLRCKAENPKAAPHDGTCQVYSPGADCRSFVASICSADIRRGAPACRRSNSSGLMRVCIVPRASSPGIAASDLGVRSLCACGNWEGTRGAVCRNCAQANEVQATTPQTSEVSAHDVEFDVMLGSPRSVTFSPGASLVWPAHRLSPNAATRKSGQTRIRVAKDARSGDADRCWLQSPPVASPKLRKFGCGVSHDELVAGWHNAAREDSCLYPSDLLSN